jgi:ubiquitin-activating enzyme E1
VLGKTTLLEFLTYFDREHELKVTKISKGADILYVVSVSPSKSNEGMDLSLTEVVERISKKKLEPDVKALVLELCCINIDNESVKIPYVLYVLLTE